MTMQLILLTSDRRRKVSRIRLLEYADEELHTCCPEGDRFVGRALTVQGELALAESVRRICLHLTSSTRTPAHLESVHQYILL